jgi:hypothetical protein
MVLVPGLTEGRNRSTVRPNPRLPSAGTGNSITQASGICFNEARLSTWSASSTANS